MGLRTGIRSSVEGGTDSAMEALEWPQTITTEQSTFLVQLNLIRSSKISRADAEKSSKSFVITKIWVRPNWSQSEIFSESCLLSNPKLLRRGNRSWLLLFLSSSISSKLSPLCKTSILWEKNLWSKIKKNSLLQERAAMRLAAEVELDDRVLLRSRAKTGLKLRS